jgi:hypothetical protein
MANEPTPSRRGFAERLTIPVERRWLHAIAGVVWTGVGVLCIAYAVMWIAPEAFPEQLVLIVAGLVVAALFARFVFVGIVRKNIARIEEGPSHASAFAFQGWKSYLVAASMIVLGITLRHSPLPKPYLVPVYAGVGVALFLTSLLYHRQLVRAFRADANARSDRSDD